MGVRKLAKMIAKDGCEGIACRNCLFSNGGNACRAWLNGGSDCQEIKDQAIQWLKDHPKPKKVKPNAQPEWDGEFVPGKYYINKGGMVILCHKSLSDNSFSGSIIKPDSVWNGREGHYSNIWSKQCFRPCEVEIKVIPAKSGKENT